MFTGEKFSVWPSGCHHPIQLTQLHFFFPPALWSATTLRSTSVNLKNFKVYLSSSSQVYPRPDNTVYVCAGGSKDSLPVPLDPAKVRATNSYRQHTKESIMFNYNLSSPRWNKILTPLRRCCRWPNRWNTVQVVFQVKCKWQGDPLDIQVSSQLAVDDWEPSACYLPTTRCVWQPKTVPISPIFKISCNKSEIQFLMPGTVILALGQYLE